MKTILIFALAFFLQTQTTFASNEPIEAGSWELQISEYLENLDMEGFERVKYVLVSFSIDDSNKISIDDTSVPFLDKAIRKHLEDKILLDSKFQKNEEYLLRINFKTK